MTWPEAIYKITDDLFAFVCVLAFIGLLFAAFTDVPSELIKKWKQKS